MPPRTLMASPVCSLAPWAAASLLLAACLPVGGPDVNDHDDDAGDSPSVASSSGLAAPGSAAPTPADAGEGGLDAAAGSDGADTGGTPGTEEDPAARGAWLAGALGDCTVNFLWLKDATGDLNAGPDLGAGYPRLRAVDGDRLTFETETVGMYSGGGLRGELVLQVLAVDPASGEAVVEGSLTGGALTLRLGPQVLGPVPLVLEDAVAQSPSAPAFVDFPDGSVHPANWGLVFAPWSSAGNPVCVARARAMGF
jgi:hypothetical protein